MPNLTIYVSKELHSRLEEHRDRLNLSKVFAKAIQEEIEKMQAATTGAREDIIERLKREREELGDELHTQGLKEATEYARWLNYEELAEVSGAHQSNMAGVIRDAVDVLNSHGLDEDLERRGLSSDDFASMRYIEGLFEGLSLILREVDGNPQ
jgi:hypothetical protein